MNTTDVRERYEDFLLSGEPFVPPSVVIEDGPQFVRVELSPDALMLARIEAKLDRLLARLGAEV
jgi:hypothetical protein